MTLPAVDLLVPSTYPIEVVNGRGGYYSGLLSRPEMKVGTRFSPAAGLRGIDPTGDSEFAAIALGTARAKPGFLPLIFPFLQDKVRRRGILDGLDNGVNPSRAFTLKGVYQGAFLASLYAAADGKIILLGSYNIPGDDAEYERFQGEYRNSTKREVPSRDDFKLSLRDFREKKVPEYIIPDIVDVDLPMLRYTVKQVREILGEGELLSPDATMEWIQAARVLQRAGSAQELRQSWSTSPSTRWLGTNQEGFEEIKLSGNRRRLFDEH